MGKPALKESEVKVVVKDVIKRYTLNFTDIVNNNNKYYNLEIQEATDGKFYIYTQYGRVGGTAAKEYRACSSRFDAESEAEKIIKSKTKKGYVEVKLVQAAVGSDLGKSKIETSQVSVEDLKKIGVKVEETPETSKLHPQVADLIRTWFGVTAEFVEMNLDTKKCPLGQLSADSIIKGRDILEEARKIIHASNDVAELNRLTNLYYSNIPHNFGYTRINADVLRLDNDSKIDKAFDILDVFSNAKDVEKVISKKSPVDSQYATLHADLEFVDPTSATWKWLDAMLHKTRAGNHHFLGNLKAHKIFKVTRHNEEKLFLETAEEIAKECGKSNPSQVYAQLVKERPDVPKELRDVYAKANILPGWHGTRRANMIGITTKGLLIRPSGVVHAGSMYGDGIYWATQSTKSINYCDVRGSYWAQGTNKTAYLFLADVAYGNYKLASGSYFYNRSNIKPCHSVFAQGGKSSVINDEIITYVPSGKGQQHCIRYIIEFETQVK
jgi:predicted DNA-binding WGR domain protein